MWPRAKGPGRARRCGPLAAPRGSAGGLAPAGELRKAGRAACQNSMLEATNRMSLLFKSSLRALFKVLLSSFKGLLKILKGLFKVTSKSFNSFDG